MLPMPPVPLVRSANAAAARSNGLTIWLPVIYSYPKVTQTTQKPLIANIQMGPGWTPRGSHQRIPPDPQDAYCQKAPEDPPDPPEDPWRIPPEDPQRPSAK
jgi:hypothetical protein